MERGKPTEVAAVHVTAGVDENLGDARFAVRVRCIVQRGAPVLLLHAPASEGRAAHGVYGTHIYTCHAKGTSHPRKALIITGGS